MPSRLILACGFLLAATLSSFATEPPLLSGRITDSMTGAPISGASVEVLIPLEDESYSFTTDARGIYGVTDVSIADPAPTRAYLSSAYPNPSLGRATVSYSLPGELTLYDTRGRTVAHADLDGTTASVDIKHPLAAGVYVIALRSGGLVMATEKLLVRDPLKTIRVEFRESIINTGESKPREQGEAKTWEYPALAFINVQKDGYISRSTLTVLWTAGEMDRSYVLAPIPTTFRIHGILADQTCSTPLHPATVAVSTADGNIYRNPVTSAGAFDLTIPPAGDGDVQLWIEDLSGYEGDTFTLCKMGLPSAVGVTASCMSLCEPDTMSLPLRELAYPGGHYLLALETAMAVNDTMLDMVSPTRGIAKWQQPHIRLLKQRNTVEYHDPLPEIVSTNIDRAMEWLTDQFETDLGLSFIETVVRDSFLAPMDSTRFDDFYGAAVFQCRTTTTVPGNLTYPGRNAAYLPDGYSNAVYVSGHGTTHQNSTILYILEITEALGVTDYLGGTNSLGFMFDSDGSFAFNHMGATIWSLVFTYEPGTLFRCP